MQDMVLLSAQTEASTPASLVDPNDDLWLEFLNSLQQPLGFDPSEKSSSNDLNQNSRMIDNDDASEDPDFTVSLDNCELDDPDDWFQVPKKETIALVKDALEFCDEVPIVCEEARSRKKSSSSPKNSQIRIVADGGEFVPSFTQLQRNQLDEQLRNHVQLLSQTCLACFSVGEFKNIFDEAFNLIKVLADIDKIKSIEKEDSAQIKLAPEFQVANVEDAVSLVSGLDERQIETTPHFDPKKGVSNKILEILVTSPVFYNLSLLPNFRFKYLSHFKRSQFSDTEKILLIMGFNKFKHLPKDECCECIREHLLPHRNCQDIKKQISQISNSEQRQASLKELLKKQKMLVHNSLHSLSFNKALHYKSPLEQAERSEHAQLPSIYTMAIERVKMAGIVKESKRRISEMGGISAFREKLKEKEDNGHIRNLPRGSDGGGGGGEGENENEVTVIEACSEPEDNSHEATKKDKRRKRRSSNSLDASFDAQKAKKNGTIETEEIIHLIEDDFLKETSPMNSTIDFSCNNQQQSIIINTNLPNSFQILPVQPQQAQFYQPMAPVPLIIPSGYAGPILFQPTIHIHTNDKKLALLSAMSKFKTIKPKSNK